MNKNISAALLSLIILGCGNNAAEKNREDNSLEAIADTSVIDSSMIVDEPLNSDVEIREADTGSSVIEDVIPAHTLPVSGIKKTIDNINQSIHLIITDVNPGTYNVRITHSNPEANIRISQIELPDGNTDGPFGREMKLNARQKGDYTIIISKSNMASGSPVGDVFITIEK